MKNCAVCGKPIESERDAWREVQGWTRVRVSGWDNAISLRKQTGRVMHNACMALKKSNIHPNQTSLA